MKYRISSKKKMNDDFSDIQNYEIRIKNSENIIVPIYIILSMLQNNEKYYLKIPKMQWKYIQTGMIDFSDAGHGDQRNQ